MKYYIVLITFCLSFSGQAQNQVESSTLEPTACELNKSYYYQYLKNGLFADARSFWLKAYKECGATNNLDDVFFNNGCVIYNNLAKMSDQDSLIHEQLIDSLEWVSEKRISINPDPLLKLELAARMMKRNTPDINKITELFEAVNEMQGKTPATYLKLNFKHILLNTFNNASTADRDKLRVVIYKDYLRLMDYAHSGIQFTTNNPELEKDRSAYEGAVEYLNRYVKQLNISTDLVTSEMEYNFAELPSDTTRRLEMLNQSLATMEIFDCKLTDTYAKYAQASMALSPTVSGYLALAEIAELNKKYPDQIIALKNALTIAKEAFTENDIKYKLALAYYENQQYGLAFKTAKTVEGDWVGRSYIICGNAIAQLANSCGETTFERKANYWLANDYYVKAANKGEAVSRTQYLKYAPTTQETFAVGKSAGQSIRLSCWNEETIIRF